MARSAAQSDFSVARAPEVDERSESGRRDPDGAAPAASAAEAGDLATRWMMRIALLMLVLLTALCAIGPHIPSGE